MRVCVYARVSTTRQAENDLSIPDQLGQMGDWCRVQGRQVVIEYIEPAASATDDKRPVFRQMGAQGMRQPHPYEAIVINGDEAAIHGSYDRLSAAIRQTKKGTLDQVPSFMGEWRARED
jgi:hypothetical protein